MLGLHKHRRTNLIIALFFSVLALCCGALITAFYGSQVWRFSLFREIPHPPRHWKVVTAYVEGIRMEIVPDSMPRNWDPSILMFMAGEGRGVHFRFRPPKLDKNYYSEQKFVEALEKRYPIGRKYTYYYDQNDTKTRSYLPPKRMKEQVEPEKCVSPVLYFAVPALIALFFFSLSLVGYFSRPQIPAPEHPPRPQRGSGYGPAPQKRASDKRSFLYFLVLVILVVPAVVAYVFWEKNRMKNEHRIDLHLAAETGRLDSVRQLIGANIKIKNPSRLPEGHLARHINSRNRFGFTALHLAAFVGHGDVVALLLERGAKVNWLNWDGETALDLASNDTIRKKLRRHGAKTGAELRRTKGRP